MGRKMAWEDADGDELDFLDEGDGYLVLRVNGIQEFVLSPADALDVGGYLMTWAGGES